jgi:hypothetical protein
MLIINSTCSEAQVLMPTASMTCLSMILTLLDGLSAIISQTQNAYPKLEQVTLRLLWIAGSSLSEAVTVKIT